MKIKCGCGKLINSNLNGTDRENSKMNIQSILRAFRNHLDEKHDSAENLDRAIQDLEVTSNE